MSERPGTPEVTWAAQPERQLTTVARNVSTRYAVILVETVVGLLLLPFNLHHLGVVDYGLWILVGSVTMHFSLLDLGYGGGMVKFVAQYRAHRDSRAINEIASTMFVVMATFGLLAYGVAALLAFNLQTLLPSLTAEQAILGRSLLLMIAVLVALNFPFGVFGAITNGFQRYDANNAVAISTTVVAALVNVAVLLAGFGLAVLVACTTFVRIVAFLFYRRTAYRVYPALRISPALARRARLREITGFSVYSGLIDWANKLNYQLDEVVIGAFLGPAYVAVWAVAERIVSGTQRLTNQLNGVLFPLIVDSDTTKNQARLQQILHQGTRLSLATVVPIAVVLTVLGDVLIRAWTRTDMSAAVPVLQILAVAVCVRVGNATGNTLLKGSGRHKLVAWTNLAMGVTNVALSIYLVGRYGLVGVAVGTLIPVIFCAVFILNPAACRRVGLPIRRQVLHSILPALWPAVVMAVVMLYTERISGGTLLAVGLQAGVGAVVYYALFFGVAIGREDRALYVAKARELAGRPGQRPVRVAPQTAGGRTA
jgi:O-antigen/teichoic acid export membrane protein